VGYKGSGYKVYNSVRRVIVTINYYKVIEFEKGSDYLRIFTSYTNYLFIMLNIVKPEDLRKGNTINPNASISRKEYVDIAPKFLLVELTNDNNIKENKKNKENIKNNTKINILSTPREVFLNVP